MKICELNVSCFFVIVSITFHLIFVFLGRAVLQKRIMALLRKIEHSTLGNAQVLLLHLNQLALPLAVLTMLFFVCSLFLPHDAK